MIKQSFAGFLHVLPMELRYRCFVEGDGEIFVAFCQREWSKIEVMAAQQVISLAITS